MQDIRQRRRRQRNASHALHNMPDIENGLTEGGWSPLAGGDIKADAKLNAEGDFGALGVSPSTFTPASARGNPLSRYQMDFQEVCVFDPIQDMHPMEC
jgi:hypothetical protein